jgi:hypothetical protein
VMLRLSEVVACCALFVADPNAYTLRRGFISSTLVISDLEGSLSTSHLCASTPGANVKPIVRASTPGANVKPIVRAVLTLASL